MDFVYMEKTIAILGATGSVGLQAADVAEKRGYRVDFLSANRDVSGLETLARKFKPKAVAIAVEESRHYKQIAKTAFTVSQAYNSFIYRYIM